MVERTYDAEVAILSDDGTFDPEAVKLLKDSFIDMGMLGDRPPDDKIFTTRFVPVKP